MQSTSELPPVERWWPHLDIPAKQWVVSHFGEPLPAGIIAEICTLCDTEDTLADATVILTDAERDFIQTQIEFVD
jgi:hypothetical protein